MIPSPPIFSRQKSPIEIARKPLNLHLGLVGSILHGLDECELLDSGIEEDVLDVEELEEDPLNLCSSCTRSLPRVFNINSIIK